MKPHLDSDLLRTLIAISEAKNFTHASEVVGRTQSAVSVQMKKLEEIVDERLFNRGPRGVALTPAGEQLVRDSKRIISLLDQAAISVHSDNLDGSIKIGVPEEYGGTILPRVLYEFSKVHPKVEVTVHCACSSELRGKFDKGKLDLIVTHEDAAMIRGEVLINDPVVWVTSDKHFQHEYDPLPIAAYERGCWWRDWSLSVLEQRQKNFRLTYESSSTLGLQAAVSSGIAVAILAQSQIPAGCRELTEEEGFPSLHGSSIVLRQREDTDCATNAGMAQAIRDAFQKPEQE